MSKERKIENRWTEIAEKRVLGKQIVAVEYMSDQEADYMVWHNRPGAFKLNDGSWLYSQCDDEGNDGGAMHYANQEDSEIFPVIGIGD